MTISLIYEETLLSQPETFEFDVRLANRVRSRLATEPLIEARRYAGPAFSGYLSIFEAGRADVQTDSVPPVEGASVGKSFQLVAQEVAAQLSSGSRTEALDCPFLYVVHFFVPPDRQAEFDAWYEEEHMGILLRCPSWIMCRRGRVTASQDDAPTHLALHYLSDLGALESAEREEARKTPWRVQLGAEAWYKRTTYRLFYRLGSCITRAG